ncbi:hypothetical protein [Ideonella sp. YS5]|uniref:hypothetical protein n=1 Tax=Ideonella sp. YS5 TaxID=3453714 RepID=UPI003EE843CC
MDSPRRPLGSLEAWPGESLRQPLRLLERPRARAEVRATDSRAGAASPLSGWLQRLRHALLAG